MADNADAQPPPETKLLPDPPTDGVSRMLYLPTSASSSSSRLATTSWDGTVCLYDTVEHKRVLSHAMESGPLLSMAAPGTMNAVVTGGLDGSIRMLDLETSNLQTVGRHGMSESSDNGKVACSCLAALSTPAEQSPLVASAGWDSQFHIWDVRQQKPVATVKLPGKAFSMDFDAVNNRVVVATSGRRTCFFDVRNPASMDSMILERESSLKYQTRCVRFFPDGAAITLGSVEGRVAVEFLEELNMSTGGRKKYAFKCHRSGDLVYPVNCIEFHPSYGTFATGGCDGSVGTYNM
jgi:cell cycle arrest protein BUB3